MGKARTKNSEKKREKKGRTATGKSEKKKTAPSPEIEHPPSGIENVEREAPHEEIIPAVSPALPGHQHSLQSACYIDYENLFYSARRSGHSICAPKTVRILNKLSREIAGEGFFKTAVYANWDTIVPVQRHAQDDWNMVGWHTIAVPTKEDYWSGQPVKNLVDFLMSLDILEDSYSLPLDLVFLVSGDKDFVEVVERLKRKRIKVIVVSLKPNLSFRLQEAADEFIVLNCDQITGEEPPPLDTYGRDRRMARRQSQEPKRREPEDEFQLLRKSIEKAQRDQNMSPILWNVVRDEYFLNDTRMTAEEANAFVHQLQEGGFVFISLPW